MHPALPLGTAAFFGGSEKIHALSPTVKRNRRAAGIFISTAQRFSSTVSCTFKPADKAFRACILAASRSWSR